MKNTLPKTVGPTIGVEFATKNVSMKDGGIVKAQLWDTAGQEKYRAITVAHYRKALGCLIVYDISNRKTFNNVKYWLQSLLDSAEQDICIMLVGNKVDLVETDPSCRQVTQEDARQLCAQYRDMKFVETSTVTNAKVQFAFQDLLQEIYSRRQNMPASFPREALKIHNQYPSPNEQAGWCGGCS